MPSFDSAIIALIPAGAHSDVHSTLVTFDRELFPQMRNIVSSMACLGVMPWAHVTRHATLGEGDTVEVAMLEGTALRGLYDLVEQYNTGPWGYSPHISSQNGYVLPAVGTFVTFDRIAVWDGDVRAAWRMSTGAPCAP